jgi:hypothetical protein
MKDWVARVLCFLIPEYRCKSSLQLADGNIVFAVPTAQDYSQLKNTYSKEEPETIFNMTSNIISGQVSRETAKLLSERFPKIIQGRQSLSINNSYMSVSKSKQLESCIPASANVFNR